MDAIYLVLITLSENRLRWVVKKFIRFGFKIL